MSEHASEEQLLELALDQTTDTQVPVLQHVASCPSCRAAYDGLCRVVDATLAASPVIAPPAGFESRVLARLGDPPAPAPGTRWRLPLLAAACVAAGVLLGGLAVSVLDGDEAAPDPTYPAAGQRLLTTDGVDVGSALRTRYDGREVLVIVVEDGSPGTEYVCRLRRTDGTTLDAGRWTIPSSGRAVWVTPVPADGARLELVAAGTGRVWATTELTE